MNYSSNLCSPEALFRVVLFLFLPPTCSMTLTSLYGITTYGWLICFEIDSSSFFPHKWITNSSLLLFCNSAASGKEKVLILTPRIPRIGSSLFDHEWINHFQLCFKWPQNCVSISFNIVKSEKRSSRRGWKSVWQFDAQSGLLSKRTTAALTKNELVLESKIDFSA